jgi:hypothetical protein
MSAEVATMALQQRTVQQRQIRLASLAVILVADGDE